MKAWIIAPTLVVALSLGLANNTHAQARLHVDAGPDARTRNVTKSPSAQARSSEGRREASSKASINVADVMYDPTAAGSSEHPDDTFPLLDDVEIQTQHYTPGGGKDGVAIDTEVLVYSNINGTLAFPPGANRLIADDVTTAAVHGCAVSAYQILVTGFGDGTGPGFTVDFGIYDACPGDGGQLVPGTEGSMALDNDGTHLIIIDLQGSGVFIPRNFWVGIEFDTATSGWVMGAPAGIGFTDDVYDHPLLPCTARFGGSGLYAGFYIQVYCNDDPDVEFLAYSNPELDAPIYAPGGGQWMADDITLIVEDCELSSVELAVIGGSAFTMNAELWQFCGLDFVIAGTERTYQGQGHGSVEIARFEFDPGTVTLGSDSLWIAWRFSNPHSGPIISGEPILGHTEDMFAVVNGSTCDFFWFGGELYAGFNANIRCLGQPPGPGACCDLSVPGEPICRESFAVDCNDPLTRWAEGASCSDPEAFDPPCGTSACCRWWGRCDDLIEGDCGALGGAWYGGDLCDDPSFRCPDYSRCFLAGWTPSCCDLVCGIDDYCCYYHWDAVCESLAYELCCTADEVTWLDPPDRVVDARQPHALYDPNDLQGIDTIRTQAAAGDDPKCWALCETDVGEYGPNAINEVAATGDGTFTLTLERPVTPGAVTTVSYADDRSIATFTSHPGNADGDGETGPPDILALIDFLNGGTSLPWGIYSCDLDRDGECAPADILRLIDLLNGAGEFDSWDETPLPVDPGICP